MPSLKTFLLSSSILALASAATAGPLDVAAPDFGQPTGLALASVAPASAAPAVPASLGAPGTGAASTAAVVPGANPFVAPPPAPAPVQASAAPAAPGAANPFAVPSPAAANASDPGKAASFDPDGSPAAGTDAAAEGDPNAIDEGALRYYASTRDLVRVGAEIRRLKSLHPDWQPPTDLFVSSATADESALWALFTKNDLPGLDAAIAARAKSQPGWKPSADLSQKIDTARSRAEISAAAARGDWNGVIAAAGKHPGALVCGNMDVLWSLGESYSRTGNYARAFDLYAYVLKSCDDSHERLATYQKASTLLPAPGTKSLAALGRPLPNGLVEFANQQFDVVRAAMGKVAAGESKDPVDPAVLQGLATEIGRSRSQGDAMLFGWYLYALEDFAGAADWFKAAAQLGPDPKAVEGYILSLRNGGHQDDAAALAYANRGRSPDVAKIYVEIVAGQLTDGNASATLDDNAVRRFSEVVDASKSALGAQSLGWNLLAHDRIDDARDWFAKSVEWQPTKEGVTGLAVVAARSKNKGELKTIKQRFGDDFPLLASFRESAPSRPANAGKAVVKTARTGGQARSGQGGGGDGGASSAMMAEANAAFKAKDYRRTLEILDRRGAAYGRNGGAEVLRGWANLKLGRYDEARRTFKEENKRNSTKDTRFGIGAVSNEQYGMWD